MEQHFRHIIEGIGEDPSREGLVKIPNVLPALLNL